MKDYQLDYVMKKSCSYIPLKECASSNNVDTARANAQLVCAFNRNIASVYGYSMTADLAGRIAMERPGDVLKELDSFKDHLLKDILGDMEDLEKGRPFYKNFPEEVMNADEVNLYMNALVYYAGSTYGLQLKGVHKMFEDFGLIDDEALKRPDLKAEFKDIRYIGLADEAMFASILKNSIEGRAMPLWERNILFQYADDETDDFIKLLKDTDIESHDIKAYICARLYKLGRGAIILSRFGENMTGRDILRFIKLVSIYNDNKDLNGAARDIVEKDIDISPDKFRIHLYAADKRFVKELIAASKSVFRDIWMNEKTWKIVMNHVHPKKGLGRSVVLFDRLYNRDKRDENGKPVYTSEAKIDRDLKKHDVSGLFYDAENISGAFMRNAVHIATWLKADNSDMYISALMKKAATKADPAVTLQVANAVSMTNPDLFNGKGINDRYARTADGQIVKQKSTSAIALTDDEWIETKAKMLEGIRDGLDDALCGKENAGRVYIESALRTIKIPQRQDTLSASDGCILPTGSVTELGDGNIILFGIWWYNEKDPQVDIDLAVHFYKDLDDVSAENTETIAYTNLKNSFAVHSGDFVESDPFGDGTGAMELVAVDKKLMLGKGYRYAICEVNDFNGNFTDSGKVRAFFMSRNGSLDIEKADMEFKRSHKYSSGNEKHEKHLCFDGELIEPSLFESNMVVSGNGTSKITQMIDVMEDKVLTIDQPYSACMNIIDCNRHEENKETRYIQRLNASAVATLANIASHNVQPSVFELVAAYVLRNHGELVNSPEDADTVFSVYPLDGSLHGGAEVYSTLTFGEFMQKITKTGNGGNGDNE